MKNKIAKIYLFFILTIVPTIVFFIVQNKFVYSADTVITTVKISVCGNGIKESGEECDNADLASRSCSYYGYNAGTLTCEPDCTINNNNCSNTTPPSGGGGGGGGGSNPPPPPQPVTGINVSGRAYPLSRVTVLKDGQIAATTIAGPDANFQVQLSGLSAGSYNLTVYGTDNQDRQSSLFNFTVFVNIGSVTTIGGIFISPTIAVDKNQVRQGDNIAIFGQTVPIADVTIRVNSEQELFEQTTADANGIYLLNFDTSPLEKGNHLAASKSAKSSNISNFGKTVAFAVGDSNIGQEPGEGCSDFRGDVNCDARVNLVDFSIAAFWFRKTGFPANVDVNGDGQISLVDFSILAYNWTG